MWHEARKQEKKIRGIMVDYKKRAERRRDFYEKIKADPTQFLQIHGRPAKIHLDPAVVAAADSPASMMPWQGHQDLLIDRFDVRAHLDHISENVSKEPAPNEIVPREDRMINYERYRIIVQNEFLGVDEEKFLHQLYLEEQFGPVPRPPEDKKQKQPRGGEKAAIPYTYEDTPPAPVPAEKPDPEGPEPAEEARDDDDDDDSDIDFDLCVDVSQVSPDQAHEMNKCGANYGMVGVDFFSFLTNDVEEKESLRLAREQEEEKAMYSGRKSRRERRAFREKRLQGRKISPPSYAARTSPTYDPYRKSTSKSRSRSHSPSPSVPGQITYITSFGGEEEGGAAPPQPQAGTSRCPPASRSRSPHRPAASKWSSRSSRESLLDKSRASRSPDRYRGRVREERLYYRRNRSRSSSRQMSRRRRSASSSSLGSERSRNRGSVHSFSKDQQDAATQPLPPPPVRRYYGRRGASSSSELDVSDSDSEKKTDSTSERDKPATTKNLGSTGLFGNSGAGTKKIAPQERLKRKMQILLNKQFKADKRAERLRYAKQEQERQDREDELRMMAIKLRRREREKRHRMKDGDEEEDDLDGEEYLEDGEDEREGRDPGLSSVSSSSPVRSPSPPPAQYRRNRWDQADSSRDREMERRRELLAEQHREMDAGRRREAEFERRRQAVGEWEHAEMYRRRRPEHQDYRRERDNYWDSYREGYRERVPGSREREPGYREREPGYREREPGYRERDLSYRDREPSSREREPGYRERDPSYRERVPGFREREPGSRERELGSREREPNWERERPSRSPPRKSKPRYGEDRPYSSHWRS
ncbi:CLK4-associating serine/arginine rich protein-like isoform X2 [Bacillus rossius redtenbacheri]|uniref:CLK4-associating serine/arginine rich protein-like isoform X2 n=1 Tax=Bacillus rossius redtenbacheri TaxID=93214 RepID=UPI002FDD0A60